MLPLPGGAGLAPVLNDARRLADFTLPAGTFKRFDLEQVIRLLLDVTSGLSALHEVEVDGVTFAHGEVAPQNIYVDEHGTARLVPLLSSHLTPGAKPDPTGYAAPERLLGDTIDGRADVFSVGAMLWEALSGQRLFPDPSAAGVLARLVGSKPLPLRLGPRLAWAQPLCKIAERAISPDPAARFSSVLELSNAMAAAAAAQLSKVDTDAWQEEAPTPVFQPGLHLGTLRATTPQPQVIDIAPSSSAQPPPLPQETPESARIAAPESARIAAPESESEAARDPMQDWRSGRRSRGFVLGAVAVVLLAVGVTAPRSASMVQQVKERGSSAKTWLTSRLGSAGHAAARIESDASEAPAAPKVAQPSATTSIAPPTALSATSAPSSSTRLPATLRPAPKGALAPSPAAPPRGRAKSADSGADYGI